MGAATVFDRDFSRRLQRAQPSRDRRLATGHVDVVVVEIVRRVLRVDGRENKRYLYRECPPITSTLHCPSHFLLRPALDTSSHRFSHGRVSLSDHNFARHFIFITLLDTRTSARVYLSSAAHYLYTSGLFFQFIYIYNSNW